MKYLQLFEKYLETNYSPLYHYTKYYIELILNSDLLKVKPPYIGKDCICFTRNPIYGFDNTVSPRLKLDQNKLRLNGYVPKSIDEFKDDAYSQIRKLGRSRFRYKNVNHTEWEYEERIYKDIHEIGKYIISIQLPVFKTFKTINYEDDFHWIKDLSDTEILVSPYFFDNVYNKIYSDDILKSKFFKEYLKKYPNIIIEYYNIEKRWKTYPL